MENGNEKDDRIGPSVELSERPVDDNGPSFAYEDPCMSMWTSRGL